MFPFVIPVSGTIRSRSIRPEWTFGAAEPSAHGSTEGIREPRPFAAPHVEQVAAGREVVPDRQDLLK
jgi:hypothetical protein